MKFIQRRREFLACAFILLAFPLLFLHDYSSSDTSGHALLLVRHMRI